MLGPKASNSGAYLQSQNPGRLWQEDCKFKANLEHRSTLSQNKMKMGSWAQGIPVIPVAQEAEVRGSQVGGQAGQLSQYIFLKRL